MATGNMKKNGLKLLNGKQERKKRKTIMKEERKRKENNPYDSINIRKCQYEKRKKTKQKTFERNIERKKHKRNTKAGR